MKKRRLSENIILRNNKYGYRANINTPKINKLYQNYRKHKGLPIWCPLSDAERIQFDAIFIWWLHKRGINTSKRWKYGCKQNDTTARLNIEILMRARKNGVSN